MAKRKIRLVESKLGAVVAEGVVTYPDDALRRPHQVAELIHSMLGDEPVESFLAVLLDSRHKVVSVVIVSKGTLTASLVHPREVFGPAVRLGAAAIVVAHNHPSGDPEPSVEDITLTKRLVGCGELLGIPLLDHIIVGASDSLPSFKSLKMEGIM